MIKPGRMAVVGMVVLLWGGCGTEASPGEIEQAEELTPGELLGKEDSAGVAGLPVAGRYADTQVWEVRNRWGDRDTPAARQAGPAWGEDSSLNWDEKFSRWIGSLQKMPSLGWGDTFGLTTPWGKTLPAPKLDCADAAILLRASFAAWYNLPFYLVAHDGSTKVFFGHFGIRTARGVWNGMPNFARAYRDHTSLTPAQYQASWPQDSALRSRGVQSGDDQPFLGTGARTGTYLDEIHLNKRAGHFIRLLLVYTGSANLADGLNTFNLVPEALRTGDVLLFRRARTGAGHTMVVVRVDRLDGGRLQAEDVYGNLPPAQPVWQSAAETRRNFTNDEGGGPTQNSLGEVYARIGGGLKRFRVAADVGGYWTNTWMPGDEASWINDRDTDRIGARPAQFAALLGEATPAARRDVLLGIIAAKREHLAQYPASCSAREARERACDDLYPLMAEHFGMDRTAVDRAHRVLADYVFAELDYLRSKTCCWNSTTPQMARIIMDYNEGLQASGCTDAAVFRARGGGYDLFRAFAESTGRAAQWIAWSEDEACPQRGVADDTEAVHHWTPWCDLGAAVPPPPACPDDAFEENDDRVAARALSAGSIEGRICSGDEDWFAVTGTGRTLAVTLRFRHADGDLDLELLTAAGARIASSAGVSDVETVETATVSGTPYLVRTYGYRSAAGAYRLETAFR